MQRDTVNVFINIEKTIVKWLAQDYQRRRLRQAINRAYAAFAGQYPLWAESLFDKRFLRHKAAPLLNGYLTGESGPDAATLAKAWTEQMRYLDENLRQRHIAALTLVAADFLRLLEAELYDNQGSTFKVQFA